jgi:colanic acid biosynthesis glycosyl transferase WcaI
LQNKSDVGRHVRVLPPWAPFVAHGESPQREKAFRRSHGFGDKRVVMYSGNLSPVHPIGTVLEAARALRDDARLLFVFVGGGLGRLEVERYTRIHALRNVSLLPYQPLAELPMSLMAADLHLVSMGDAMVGIVHPSKIYGALAAGRPILALGPQHSHIGDLVERHRLGWRIDHGDTDAAIGALREFANADPSELVAFGQRGRQLAEDQFSKDRLLGEFCTELTTARQSHQTP